MSPQASTYTILLVPRNYHNNDHYCPANLLLGYCFPKPVDSGIQGPGSKLQGTPCLQSFHFFLLYMPSLRRQSEQLLLEEVPASLLEHGPYPLPFFFSPHFAKHTAHLFRMLVFPVSCWLTLIHMCSPLPHHRDSIHFSVRKTRCAPALFWQLWAAALLPSMRNVIEGKQNCPSHWQRADISPLPGKELLAYLQDEHLKYILKVLKKY